MFHDLTRVRSHFFGACLLLALTGCMGGAPGPGDSPGEGDGTARVTPADPAPGGDDDTGVVPSNHARCTGGAADQLCLGLKVVSYTDSSGGLSTTEAEAEALVR